MTDLDRSASFYQDALGLRVQRREDGVAALGAGGEDLVVLNEVPGARRPGREAGLYHYALLYPSRHELARALERVALARAPIQGASDHGVSEAIYLPDPDGNGIELYADRPREQWPPPSTPGDRVGMFTEALDLDGLLSTVAEEDTPAAAGDGLRMGHVHLHVGDVARGLGFYRDVVGFEEMVDLGTAAFVSAGGYHHHLGFNVWRGPGVGPARRDAVGLRHWTVVLPSSAEVAALAARAEAAGVPVEQHDGGVLVRDPWDIPMLVTAAA